MDQMLQINTLRFKTQSLPKGGLLLIDGGIHGIQGHTLQIAPDGSTRWARRCDGLFPAGSEGDGELILENNVMTTVRAWMDILLSRYQDRAQMFFIGQENEPRPCRWVWAAAAERNGIVALVQGGAVYGLEAPPDLAPMLTRLREMVDAWSESR